MEGKISVKNNSGIINLGTSITNEIYTNSNNVNEIIWERIAAEINEMQKSEIQTLRDFANTSSNIISNKDTKRLRTWLENWIPHVGKFLESTYYIFEIAERFGI